MVRKIKNIFHFFNALAAVFWYGYPAKKLTVIGVTGTDGKTTTSTLIYHLLKNAGKSIALITTVGGFIGDKEIDTGFHTTTPNPWKLQKLIKQIVDQGYSFLVLESTSHGLDQHRLLGTNPSVGVITNLTHEHLDYHKTMHNYLLAKAKLLKKVKYPVLNASDQFFEDFKKEVGGFVITYSDQNTPKFVKDRFPEKYNQLNAQAAITVARLFNIEESIISDAITSFPGVRGRFESVKNNSGINIFVDFAHTPNAIEKVLTALRAKTKGKLITVFGATGRRDKSKRPIMGNIVASLADFFIITTDDSYDEKIDVIINQIKSGITNNHGNMASITDREIAINFAFNLAKSGDTIALLGKGHEKSLNIDGKTEIPWSDQLAALKALANRKKTV